MNDRLLDTLLLRGVGPVGEAGRDQAEPVVEAVAAGLDVITAFHIVHSHAMGRSRWSLRIIATL